MNVMQMGQQVLSRSPFPVGKGEKSVLPQQKPARTRGVFHRMNHLGNGMTFLVSFLTYLLGIFPSLVYALPTETDRTRRRAQAEIAHSGGLAEPKGERDQTSGNRRPGS